MAYVAEILERFYEPDFDGLEISGQLRNYGPDTTLSIRAWEGEGVIRSLDLDSSFPGDVSIRAREGSPVDAFHRDIEGNVCAQWLQAGRYSGDFPIGAEVYWHSGGRLEIHVCPVL